MICARGAPLPDDPVPLGAACSHFRLHESQFKPPDIPQNTDNIAI